MSSTSTQTTPEQQAASLAPQSEPALSDEASEGFASNPTPNLDSSREKEQYFSFDLRKIVISLFLAWQIGAVAIWTIPGQCARLNLNLLVEPYMLSTGEWQQWTMFSPEPARVNFYIEARIEYADGEVRWWHFPRVRDMGFVERYQRERYRKFMEICYPDTGTRLRPYLARYIALENDRAGDPKAYPLTVHLIRHVQVMTDYPKPFNPPTNEEFYEQTFESSPAATLGKHE